MAGASDGPRRCTRWTSHSAMGTSSGEAARSRSAFSIAEARLLAVTPPCISAASSRDLRHGDAGTAVSVQVLVLYTGILWI